MVNIGHPIQAEIAQSGDSGGTRTFSRYGPVDGRGGFGHASTMAGIAKLWKPVINVTDLDQGERFWSAVSGLSPRGRHGQFSVLDVDDAGDREGWILLQLVPRGQESIRSGMHVDFRVDDVGRATAQIEAISGTTVRPPSSTLRKVGISSNG